MRKAGILEEKVEDTMSRVEGEEEEEDPHSRAFYATYICVILAGR